MEREKEVRGMEREFSIAEIAASWEMVKEERERRKERQGSREKEQQGNREKERHRGQNKKQPESNKTKEQEKKRDERGERGERGEEVCYHVYVRGVNSYLIFYDDEDRSYFLIYLNEAVKFYEGRVSAYILMDNHFHIQITTRELSKIMGHLLSRYSRRFKSRHGINGEVFQRPFGRSPIYSTLLLKENLLYILSNASRDLICPTHRDYIWSSYNAHPEVISLRKRGFLPILFKLADGEERYYCASGLEELPKLKRKVGGLFSEKRISQYDLNLLIQVECGYMLELFPSFNDLDNAIFNYRPFRDFERGSGAKKERSRVSKRVLTSQVASRFLLRLEGRELSAMGGAELRKIYWALYRECGASRWQLNSVLRMG